MQVGHNGIEVSNKTSVKVAKTWETLQLFLTSGCRPLGHSANLDLVHPDAVLGFLANFHSLKIFHLHQSALKPCDTGKEKENSFSLNERMRRRNRGMGMGH